MFKVSDLKVLMSKLEHWAHRLHPTATFDEFIAKMEKLGQKKDVQVFKDIKMFSKSGKQSKFDADFFFVELYAENSTRHANY